MKKKPIKADKKLKKAIIEAQIVTLALYEKKEELFTRERVEHLCRVAMRYGNSVARVHSEGFFDDKENEWITKNVN